MKKTLYTFAIASAIFTSCSSNEDNSTESEIIINKTLPAELIGSWKIKYAILANDPDFVGGNDIGYYIKFNTDNTIEYKDGNKFGGVNTVNNTSINQVGKGSTSEGLTIFIKNIPEYIECKKSIKYPGQTEFKIMYPSGSVYYNMILIGTKQ